VTVRFSCDVGVQVAPLTVHAVAVATGVFVLVGGG
jgi:hypothetical protein